MKEGVDSIVGKRFGYINVVDVRKGKYSKEVRIICDCGTDKWTRHQQLKYDENQTCGCNYHRIKEYHNLIGLKINRYEIIDVIYNNEVMLQGKCQCGELFEVKPSIKHRYSSCGNCPRQQLTGMKFGSLTVLSFNKDAQGRGDQWDCKCDCGEERIVSSWALTSGNTISCGCARYGIRSRFNLIYGVGINDADYVADTSCKYYVKWHSMISRCYDEKLHERQKSYDKCTVADDWLVFSNFREWCLEQESFYGIDISKLCLDKDLLHTGNKTYSKDTCLFLPNEINVFICGENLGGTSKYSGVMFHKGQQKYVSKCSNQFTKKREWLGTFNCELSAYIAWAKRKLQLVELFEITFDDRILPLLRNRYLTYIERAENLKKEKL